jgi:hypothetical protein
MQDRLKPREQLMLDLANAVGDDPWLAYFALRCACQRLDLDQLRQLVHDIDEQDELENAVARTLYIALVRERFQR